MYNLIERNNDKFPRYFSGNDFVQSAIDIKWTSRNAPAWELFDAIRIQAQLAEFSIDVKLEWDPDKAEPVISRTEIL